jgi:hypothetical protein
MKKNLLIVATAALLSIPCFTSASAQHIYVRIGPPPVVVEHPGRRPHPGWVWVGGYHRWDGARYVWVPGNWVAPPRPHAEWVPGHWRHEAGGWYWVEGHWRG